ncbi:MAG: hydroxymethylbilane synthase [Rhodospirillaceae bacterium]|nr:hydroxymethylbilane synthase [Rhodospirillaceae bacterium]
MAVTTTPQLRVGTRGSPLARAQTAEVCARLAAAHPSLREDGAIEQVIIKTTGDMVRDRVLADIGGKGLFTKEIEEALADGRIDCAVHSMKDMPTRLPDGLAIVCMLPREDPRDAFIDRDGRSFADLPSGAVVGTASLRRAAQVLHRRPDLAVVPLRGNVHTRLRKLQEHQFDCTLLALAGLRRLSLDAVATHVMDTADMLSAVAQGAIGIEARVDDERVRNLLKPLDHGPTTTAVAAERAFLDRLDGSCRTPIAALALLDGKGGLSLRGLVVSLDGKMLFETAREGPETAAVRLGADAGEELRSRMPAGFLAEVT